MTVQILVGDVMERLADIPDESVHCVVTSPPYWGLRDYGVSGQIGLEPTLGEHLETMVKVFAEVRRVMRPDATLWLNYGDCYATSPNGRSAADTKAAGDDDRTFRDKPFSTVGPIFDPDYRVRTTGGIHAERRPDAKGRVVSGGVLKPKDLCMIPNRFAIALQEDGWWVRSEIIWAKPNPMPESTKDRPTSSHEKIWLLSKSARYYYDAEAVAESANPLSEARYRSQFHVGAKESSGAGRPDGASNTAGFKEYTGKRNLRNVWDIATRSFPDAHFATFPPQLAETCIKAGCPKGGTVLDPFGGSGTTGLVADRLERSAILIELNPEYAAMAERRIKGDAPLFTEVAAQ